MTTRQRIASTNAGAHFEGWFIQMAAFRSENRPNSEGPGRSALRSSEIAPVPQVLLLICLIGRRG